MPRPFNRRQARENAAFLRLLSQSGNARASARECGLHRGTLEKRRRRNAAFAAEWEAALAVAQSKLAHGEGPGNNPSRSSRAKSRGAGTGSPNPLRTQGGEPVLIRLKNGALQLRTARPGAIGLAAEQAFLRALAASANIRLAARAIGVAHSSIYARARRNPAFAAEMAEALALGLDRLELALQEQAEQALATGGANSLWRDGADTQPLTPMSADQAMLLLELHRRNAALGIEWTRLSKRKRRGPLSSEEIAIERRIYWHAEQRTREAQALRQARACARAGHYEQTGNWFLSGEPPAS
jgi:hypothetical protein